MWQDPHHLSLCWHKMDRFSTIFSNLDSFKHSILAGLSSRTSEQSDVCHYVSTSLDEKNVSEHKGAAGTHSPYMLQIPWFLQAVKASGGCPGLIMSRVTGTATAACGLCDEEPPGTLTCSIISLKTSMYVWGLLLHEAVSFILRREENGKNVTL